MVADWKDLGVRHMPPMSARQRVEQMPPFIREKVDERAALLAAPLGGISTDGRAITVLDPAAVRARADATLD